MSIIQTLRSVRIAQIALFDVIASIIGLYFLLKLLKPNQPTAFYASWVAISVFPISILSHLLFGIPTMLNYYLGLSVKPTN